MSLIVPGRVEQEVLSVKEPKVTAVNKSWFVPAGSSGGAWSEKVMAGAETTEAAPYVAGRITGIAENTVDERDAMVTLKRLNSYNEAVAGLSAEFSGVSKIASDTAFLQSGWREYTGKMDKLSRDYLQQEKNNAASGYFLQNIREQLERQGQRYSVRLRESIIAEEQKEVVHTTDTALLQLTSGVMDEKYISKYTQDAFTQACEEAILSGVADEEEISVYAGKRVLPAVTQVVNRYTHEGMFREAEEYLGAVNEILPEESWTELQTGVVENRLLSKARQYLLQGEKEIYEQYVTALPERVRHLAAVNARWLQQQEEAAQQQVRQQALRQAEEDMVRTGAVQPYITVAGQRVRLEAEDYEKILGLRQEVELQTASVGEGRERSIEEVPSR